MVDTREELERELERRELQEELTRREGPRFALSSPSPIEESTRGTIIPAAQTEAGEVVPAVPNFLRAPFIAAERGFRPGVSQIQPDEKGMVSDEQIADQLINQFGVGDAAALTGALQGLPGLLSPRATGATQAGGLFPIGRAPTQESLLNISPRTPTARNLAPAGNIPPSRAEALKPVELGQQLPEQFGPGGGPVTVGQSLVQLDTPVSAAATTARGRLAQQVEKGKEAARAARRLGIDEPSAAMQFPEGAIGVGIRQAEEAAGEGFFGRPLSRRAAENEARVHDTLQGAIDDTFNTVAPTVEAAGLRGLAQEFVQAEPQIAKGIWSRLGKNFPEGENTPLLAFETPGGGFQINLPKVARTLASDPEFYTRLSDVANAAGKATLPNRLRNFVETGFVGETPARIIDPLRLRTEVLEMMRNPAARAVSPSFNSRIQEFIDNFSGDIRDAVEAAGLRPHPKKSNTLKARQGRANRAVKDFDGAIQDYKDFTRAREIVNRLANAKSDAEAGRRILDFAIDPLKKDKLDAVIRGVRAIKTGKRGRTKRRDRELRTRLEASMRDSILRSIGQEVSGNTSRFNLGRGYRDVTELLKSPHARVLVPENKPLRRVINDIRNLSEEVAQHTANMSGRAQQNFSNAERSRARRLVQASVRGGLNFNVLRQRAGAGLVAGFLTGNLAIGIGMAAAMPYIMRYPPAIKALRSLLRRVSGQRKQQQARRRGIQLQTAPRPVQRTNKVQRAIVAFQAAMLRSLAPREVIQNLIGEVLGEDGGQQQQPQ